MLAAEELEMAVLEEEAAVEELETAELDDAALDEELETAAFALEDELGGTLSSVRKVNPLRYISFLA